MFEASTSHSEYVVERNDNHATGDDGTKYIVRFLNGRGRWTNAKAIKTDGSFIERTRVKIKTNVEILSLSKVRVNSGLPHFRGTLMK